MHRRFLTLVAAAMLVPAIGSAQSLVYVGPYTGGSGGGLGAQWTLLTVQSQSEDIGTGCTGEAIDPATGRTTAGADGGLCQLGDAFFDDNVTEYGTNATQARALADIGNPTLGQLGLVVNFNGNSGGEAWDPTIADLRLLFYGADGSLLWWSDAIAGPVDNPNAGEANGFGNYGFLFTLASIPSLDGVAFVGAAGDFSNMKNNVTVNLVNTASTVPEPASMVLLGTGLLGIAAAAHRRRRSRA